MKPVTHQARWILKQRELGNCVCCGQKAVNRSHCQKHRDKHAKYYHARYREWAGIPLNAPRYTRAK